MCARPKLPREYIEDFLVICSGFCRWVKDFYTTFGHIDDQQYSVKATCLYASITHYTTPDYDNTTGSKHPITVGFWTGTTIPAGMRVSYHYRFLQTGSILQLHCRFFTQPTEFRSTNTTGSLDNLAEFSSTNTVDLCFNRPCCHNKHYRFVTRTDSDG